MRDPMIIILVNVHMTATHRWSGSVLKSWFCDAHNVLYHSLRTPKMEVEVRSHLIQSAAASVKVELLDRIQQEYGKHRQNVDCNRIVHYVCMKSVHLKCDVIAIND